MDLKVPPCTGREMESSFAQIMKDAMFSSHPYLVYQLNK